MKAYLVQHGKPVPETEDPERPLSTEGRKDVEEMAQVLKNGAITIGGAYHSGKLRARQTAEIIARVLNPDLQPQPRRGLSPMDDVEEIAEEIQGSTKDLLIAGHLPHLGKLVSLVVTGDQSIPVVQFRQGAVVCLEKEEGVEWRIAWMIIPGLIR